MKKILILSSLFGLLVITNCGDSSGTDPIDCTGVVATYNGSAKSLLNTNCAGSGCHSKVDKSAGIDLSDYTGASAYLKGSNNKFLCSINHESGCVKMPEGSTKLDAASLKILNCWVNSGYPQ
ncbi:MAG: hypothetical protein HOP11_10005 [Saprospiraceae bacterium]|nr:hypothetical protein [Saprospiraceae bacterium]